MMTSTSSRRTWPAPCGRCVSTGREPRLTQRHLEAIGLPVWTNAEARLCQVRCSARAELPEIGAEARTSSRSRTGPLDPAANDAGDVSWKVPMVSVLFPGQMPGLGPHHWAAGARWLHRSLTKVRSSGPRGWALRCSSTWLTQVISSRGRGPRSSATPAERPSRRCCPPDKSRPSTSTARKWSATARKWSSTTSKNGPRYSSRSRSRGSVAARRKGCLLCNDPVARRASSVHAERQHECQLTQPPIVRAPGAYGQTGSTDVVRLLQMGEALRRASRRMTTPCSTPPATEQDHLSARGYRRETVCGAGGAGRLGGVEAGVRRPPDALLAHDARPVSARGARFGALSGRATEQCGSIMHRV